MLDIKFVRSQYKALSEGLYADWAFFENAGGSYIPRQVLDRFVEFLSEYKVQPYGPSAMATRAGDAMDAGYATIAGLLNADPDEITIGPSTTLNTYVLAQGIRRSLKPGDEIIVTNQDHEANIGSWRRLEAEGAVIRQWNIDPATGMLNIADLENLLSERTRLACFTLCSNVVGAIHDVASVCEKVHQAGALAVGDGVSFAPHHVLDVKASGLDVYLFSTYKTFAPHTGVMWMSDRAVAGFEAQGHYFNSGEPHYRMNPTGPLHAEIGALAGLADYFADLAKHHGGADTATLRQSAELLNPLFREHESQLANRLLDYLGGRHDVRVLGPARVEGGNRAATIAFTSNNHSSAQVAAALAEHRIGCGSGNFYARRCIEAMGIEPEDGVVRVSMVHYNSDDEVERLVAALDEIL